MSEQESLRHNESFWSKEAFLIPNFSSDLINEQFLYFDLNIGVMTPKQVPPLSMDVSVGGGWGGG